MEKQENYKLLFDGEKEKPLYPQHRKAIIPLLL